jgi:hypothetical protein
VRRREPLAPYRCSGRIDGVMSDQDATVLVEHWRETRGDLELRAFEDGDLVALVGRRIVDGRPVRYVYWHEYPTLQAAIDAAPIAERAALP